ncbi:hypothetical protein J4573_09200 [Actinomadura barringtoniae]|uniref:Uncharacterized protein n=1 Tax=Actinomadura barringtoniae TaxID=1427535 RepID=A0A939PDI3_9ACTN|nr:hypothetical protein [Actinomadura barringtoniae]
MAGGADVLTGRAMVVLADRPVVPMSPHLVEAARECALSERRLQIVTPVGSRVTSALRTHMIEGRAEWIVRADGGYYAGLSGRPSHWDGQAFVPVPDAMDYARPYKLKSSASQGLQVTLVLRAKHPANGPLGGPVEHLMRLFTSEAPAGWGRAEPVEHLWDPTSLGVFVRGDASSPITVVGGGERAAIAVLDFSSTDDGGGGGAGGGGGRSELTTLTIGYGPGEVPPLAQLPNMVGTVGGVHPLQSVLVHVCAGRADLTVEPRWAGAPGVVGMALNGARTGPAEIPGSQVGPQHSPMTWFALGDGRAPEGWQRYQQLLTHLRAA